ncbi:NADH dehydrogenase [Amylibacter ulvae]|uniref:NADH dehydrogenase n=2 Tax=Paramylibacter ulvae TaxID=1651968 RepID=A0ABQ3CRW1_9RHOB|nr:NADH dehydrogenase [Amylibacter ulvae]
MNPLDVVDWLIVDDAFDRQLAYADYLIGTKRDAVFAMQDGADDGAAELLELVIAALANHPDYRITDQSVARPDGVVVALDGDHPLIIARRLVQQDFCLMGKQGDEHVLEGATLCFPASWTLSEKIGQPMSRIHTPVPEFSADIARRVQRMFDTMRDGRALWRANWMVYADPDLHQPRLENAPHRPAPTGQGWMRVERQSLRLLPRSGMTVFGIHSIVVPMDALTKEQSETLTAP